MTTVGKSLSIVVVNGGSSDPSTTGLLARSIAESAERQSKRLDLDVHVSIVEVKVLAQEIAVALATNHRGPLLEQAIQSLKKADGIIAATPVYKAVTSALFTGFFQTLDSDLIVGTPVTLAGTAGSLRHSLVIDDQLRGLFSYMRAITLPTAVFASPDDWADNQLQNRIDRAAFELIALLKTGFKRTVREESWNNYQHSYGSAGGDELSIDLDSDLMRLAKGLEA